MMDAVITRAASLTGTLQLPADKAICHRAALLSALADGPTRIAPWSSADDCQRTLAIVERLGAPVTRTAEGIRITGVGVNGLTLPTGELDCGDSGTTIDFGRYAGWSVGDLVDHDPDYLEWLARTSIGRRLAGEIEAALARRATEVEALRPTGTTSRRGRH